MTRCGWEFGMKEAASSKTSGQKTHGTCAPVDSLTLFKLYSSVSFMDTGFLVLRVSRISGTLPDGALIIG